MPTENPVATATPGRTEDLQIKDARIIFDTLWAELNARGRGALRFPKELILLGGAPGAGKGTNTDFISKARGLTQAPIVMSELLDTPEMKALKDAGYMIGDREVLTALLRELHKPEYRDGAILDGFPRTKVQVEFLKMLHEEMMQLWREFHGTALATHFRKPTIHIVVLFIDEHESIARQLKRGRLTKAHNENVRLTGRGELMEERATDFNETLAARRYRVFKDKTWDALVSLKDHFHYHLINAQGAIEEVEENIAKEFRYQSSLELDPFTFTSLRAIPVASEIVIHARQELVKRLDAYALKQEALFARVVTLIETTIMPVVIRHAISGYANINLEEVVLHETDAVAMLIDVFSERGFRAVVDVHHIEIPESVDLKTGKIQCRTKRVFRIGIRFKGSEIRRG